MDEDKASRFISSLVKSIQALCNGFVDFSTSIEVIGHIHLNIDRSVKLDYVLTEEVSKSASEGSTVFSSHSYHSQAPHSVSSKSASDTANHGQKLRKDNEADPLGLSALTREVPNTHKLDSHSQSSNRGSDSSKLSHTFSGSIGFPRNSDSELVKHERSSCLVEDSSNKRRKMGPLSQLTPSSAAKRNRPNDFGSGSRTVVKDSGFDVIEIKEEPDEDVPAVFFGSSGSGQDIQTPDFSNVVMESLDRVNQLEQSTDLVGDSGEGMGGPQQPVFPVMFHQSDGMTSSSGGPVPGPSSDTQSVASTSGDRTSASSFREDRLQRSYRDVSSLPSFSMSYSIGYRRYSKASLRLGVIRVLRGETVRKVSIELQLPRETLRRHVEKAKRSFIDADTLECMENEFTDFSGSGVQSGVQPPHTDSLQTGVQTPNVQASGQISLAQNLSGVGVSSQNPDGLGTVSGSRGHTSDGVQSRDGSRKEVVGNHDPSGSIAQNRDDGFFVQYESGMLDTGEYDTAETEDTENFAPVSSQDA